MDTKFKYNIVNNDGEPSSVYVFVGAKQYLATPGHTNFQRILDLLRGSAPVDVDYLTGLFDVGVGIVKSFERLSERVSIANGKLHIDGDPAHGALSDAIVRFYMEGSDDLKPLVLFMEKIQQNPNEHSREHLFRWMQDKKIGICEDGDFIAYKGIGHDDKSITAGTAMVNGAVITGKIPNKPDTIIEMPRSKVTFDPRNGCSTGLHAGNWSYASSFGPKVVIVKINPRDVVSVPVDSSDQKLRVCRYRVLHSTQREDDKALLVGVPAATAKVWEPAAPVVTKEEVVQATADAIDSLIEKKKAEAPAAKQPRKAKKAAKKEAPVVKPEPEQTWPSHYELFTKKDFDRLEFAELRWLAKEWGVVVRGTRPALTERIVKEARARKRTWR